MGALGPLERILLAAAIGLLFGIERGWQEREARDGSRVAGIRTFTLIGMLGGFCGLLAGNNAGLQSVFFVGFALPFGLFEWQKARQAQNMSATDLVAGLLAFALGAFAASGSMFLAGGAGILATLVLAERRFLHSFLRRVRWKELRAAFLLLVMTAVLLPVLPDRTVDPWDALNPHQIWLMTVLVGLLSYGGYIAVRLMGERAGLLAAGSLGGLVTSTTVTWTFARLVRRDAAALPSLVAAILAAWIVSLIRMTAIAVAINPPLLTVLARPVLAASFLLAIPAALAWRSAGRTQSHALPLHDPLDLMLMLRFTALVAVIMLLARLMGSGAPGGLYALGGVSGVLDVDPITLSMAKLGGSSVAIPAAGLTILIAAASNGAAKAVLAVYFGGKKLGSILAFCALAAFAVGCLSLVP